MDLITAVGLLLVTVDPLGNVPSFISVLQPVAKERHAKVIVRELLFALSIMVAFVLLGRQLTGVLGIKQEAILMAGGLVLFLVALEMIFPGRGRRIIREQTDPDPFIVPLATPLVAGPAALSTIILITTKTGGVMTGLWAVLIAWGVTFVTLTSAPAIMHVLKDRGTRAVQRLMGMLLVMLSVQMVLNGASEYSRNF
jgi:MarC family membrane protein